MERPKKDQVSCNGSNYSDNIIDQPWLKPKQTPRHKSTFAKMGHEETNENRESSMMSRTLTSNITTSNEQ